MKTLHFISLFPETIQVWLSTGIIGKAQEKGLFEFKTYQLRNFSTDKHRTVDDLTYGGGGGMVLKVEPLVLALEHIQSQFPDKKLLVICPTPAGKPISQPLVQTVANDTRDIVFVCGRYEGIDQRFLDHCVELEFSLGDFVLSAGELPAIAFADALIRLSEGALGNPMGSLTESFSLVSKDRKPLLEYPQYTRPASFRGWDVPKELLTGDHPSIGQWRSEKALEKTLRVRPDLLS